MSELETLEPKSTTITLTSGTQVLLEELRLRQFLRLLRIITEGAPVDALVGPNGLAQLSSNDGQFGANLLALVMLGIPHAEDAVIRFLLSMVRPVGLIGGPDGKPRSRMTEQEIKRDEAMFDALERELSNPRLEDTFLLIEAIFRQASTDFKALGKRIASMWEVAKKAGLLKPSSPQPTSMDSISSDQLSEESTSSGPDTQELPAMTSLT